MYVCMYIYIYGRKSIHTMHMPLPMYQATLQDHSVHLRDLCDLRRHDADMAISPIDWRYHIII